MLTSKTLKTTALAVCGALIIGLSSGTAQASVAAENLIGQSELNEVLSSEERLLLEIYRHKQREKHRKEWEERHRNDWNRRDRHGYGAPPSPPRDDRRDRYGYGAPPSPPRDNHRDRNGYGPPPSPPRH